MLRKQCTVVLVTCLTGLTFCVQVFAQAWVPAKGEGSLTTVYQKVDVRDHFDDDGDVEDRGQIHTHNFITYLEYGLTDKLALDFEMAYVASKSRRRSSA